MLHWLSWYLFACVAWWRMCCWIWTLGRLLLLLLVVMLERQQLRLIFGQGSMHPLVVLHVFHFFLKAKSGEPQREQCLRGQSSWLLEILAFQKNQVSTIAAGLTEETQTWGTESIKWSQTLYVWLLEEHNRKSHFFPFTFPKTEAFDQTLHTWLWIRSLAAILGKHCGQGARLDNVTSALKITSTSFLFVKKRLSFAQSEERLETPEI